MSKQAAFSVSVQGRVQGVAFRYSTQLRAGELGVQGWVRNRHDGSVEALLEGDPDAVRQLLEWMETGPSGAKVRALHAEPCSATGVPGFEISATVR